MAKTILIVDDDVAFAEMAGYLLEDHGFSTVTARNVAQARERLAAKRPDAILLDLAMPGEDGGSLLKWLKSDSNLSAIPVAVCTVSGVAATRQKMLDLGATEFIDKSTYLKELVGLLDRLTGGPR